MGNIPSGLVLIIGLILFCKYIKQTKINRILAIIACSLYLVCIITKSDQMYVFFCLGILYSFCPMFFKYETFEDENGKIYTKRKVKFVGIIYAIGLGIILGLLVFSKDFPWLKYVISVTGILVNLISAFVTI